MKDKHPVLFPTAAKYPPAKLKTAGILNLVLAAAFIPVMILGPVFLLPVALFGCVFSLISGLKTLRLAALVPAKPEPERPKFCDVPLPKPARKVETSSTPAAYQSRLKQLQDLQAQMEQRQQSVQEFLDDFFGQSEISKARYLTTMQDAGKVMKSNYDKACQAVRMFGSAQVSAARIEILNAYVKDSQDVLDKVEKVINALILADQSGTLKSQDSLDASLDELAYTTGLYTSAH